jgi:hypothetical protein
VLGTAAPTFLDVFLALVFHYAPHPRYQWVTDNCPALVQLVTQIVNVPGIKEPFASNDLDAWIVTNA